MAQLGGEGFCQIYYESWSDSRDCVNVILKLEKGPEIIDYTTKDSTDAHALPLYVQPGQRLWNAFRSTH